MPRSITLKAWRELQWVPTPADRKREEEFLDQHLTYGCQIHIATSEALESTLEKKTSSETRSVLYLRLFAEYVNALESLGAWGWTIRNRSQCVLLFDGFLSYEPGGARMFFEAADKHQGDLSELLRLPPEQEIARRFQQGGVPAQDLLVEFDRCLTNLKQAASHYFHPDQLFLTNYNKAKHGAPIIRTTKLRDDEFLVLAPQREPSSSARYLFSKFSTEPTMVAHTSTLIRFVSNTTTALVSLARNLRRADLL